MAIISGPAVVRTMPYYKSKFRCTNQNCRKTGWRQRPGKGNICPKCYAHVEIVDVRLVIPKKDVLRCTYCQSSECGCLEVKHG